MKIGHAKVPIKDVKKAHDEFKTRVYWLARNVACNHLPTSKWSFGMAYGAPDNQIVDFANYIIDQYINDNQHC